MNKKMFTLDEETTNLNILSRLRNEIPVPMIPALQWLLFWDWSILGINNDIASGLIEFEGTTFRIEHIKDNLYTLVEHNRRSFADLEVQAMFDTKP